MFNPRNEIMLTRSFFHEASNQIQRYLSTSTLNNLQKEDNELSPKDKSFIVILYKFIKNFSKMYFIRILFTLMTSIKLKEITFSKLLQIIYKSTFNRKNLNTSLFIGLIPSCYDLLHKLINSYFGIDTNNPVMTFLIGFISAYIGISNENITSLVKFMILSILGRVIHSLFNIFLIRKNIQINNKAYAFFTFSTICVIFNCFNYYIAGFKPISSLFDKYGHLAKSEIAELNAARDSVSIFK